jgi:hypothetical protein
VEQSAGHVPNGFNPLDPLGFVNVAVLGHILCPVSQCLPRAAGDRGDGSVIKKCPMLRYRKFTAKYCPIHGINPRFR